MLTLSPSAAHKIIAPPLIGFLSGIECASNELSLRRFSRMQLHGGFRNFRRRQPASEFYRILKRRRLAAMIISKNASGQHKNIVAIINSAMQVAKVWFIHIFYG